MGLIGIIFIIAAYLIGSLSGAVLICKAMNLPDPRLAGSGNPGATNVFRLGGVVPAVCVLVFDILKGFLPVILAYWAGVHNIMLGLVALAAVVGHIYPIFFKFKGGRGVATALGGLLALAWGVALIAILVWVIVVAITRYVSLASLIATVLSAVLILYANYFYFLPLAAIAVLIVLRHRENIERLKAGTEAKVQWK